MGKKMEHPRNNVLSLRVSDPELARVKTALGEGETVQQLLYAALMFCLALRLDSKTTVRTQAIKPRSIGSGSPS